MALSFPASNLKGNLFGGITAGIIALPLALAFGVASGMGAQAGLYGAIILGFMAALFGGTPTQISGPTGPMTVIVASAVAVFSGDVNAVLMTILLAGVFQMLFGLVRVGGYVRFIPYPVISGFMSGIGVIILLLQINPLLGLPSLASTQQALIQLPASLLAADGASLMVALATVLIVFFTPKPVTRIIPAPLIALVGVSAAVAYWGVDVPTIGAIPSGLPEFVMPSVELSQLKEVLTLAVPLALLGAIDSLLTSLVADSITKTRHNPDRELVGQGLGNSLCAFFGAVPGAGATIRTVINIKVGATGRLSGVTHSLLLLSLLVGFAPLASQIPMAVLAGILVKVGVDILDYRLLRVVKAAPRHDLYVMGVVFFLTVFVDLIIAVGAGITLASILITYRMAKASQIEIADVNPEAGDSLEEQRIQERYDIRIITISGAFFFGSSSQLVDRVDAVLGTKTVIMDCSGVPFMDLSAIFALEEMAERLTGRGISVLLVLSPEKEAKIRGLNALGMIGEDAVFHERDRAVEEAVKRRKAALTL